MCGLQLQHNGVRYIADRIANSSGVVMNSEKTLPLVSVIIPTYNCEAYINETIDSSFWNVLDVYKKAVADRSEVNCHQKKMRTETISLLEKTIVTILE